MKKNHYGSMRKIILASMILVPVIPFILILGIGYYYFTTSIETSTISSMKRIVGDHRHMIESFLQERKANLEFILQSYDYEEISDPQKLYDVFIRLQKESNAFVDLGVFSEEGIHVAYQGPYKLVGRDYGKEDWFKQVMKECYYVSDIFLGFRRTPHFIIALTKEEAGIKWVLRATIDTYIFNELVKKVRIGKTGEAYILNAQGVFQTERRSGGNLMDKDQDSIAYSEPHEGIKTFIQKDSRGDEHLYATTWMKDKKWLLVVRQEKADAFKALRAASYLIVLIIVIGGSAIIGVAFYLTNRIVRRMQQMDVEKEQLSDQLIRASRLAELGEMAAGFAHEINNPLQIMKSEHALITSILSNLKEKGELSDSEDLAELEDSMDQIGSQVDRCGEITQAILKFGRQGEPVSKDVDLRNLIPEVAEMVAKKASVHGIALKQEISTDTPTIHGDPSQVQQVLLNLFNNAIDAILSKHGSSGGEMRIEAMPEENGKVVIKVTDNGCGISPENLKRVFSPFFTTKPAGKGTGLGLSVCYGIINNMGGVMEVDSEKDIGTTFTIHLLASG
ncbi:MAG: two-component sensor histidine kinase [Desulfobacterales bacterium]|nr:MAG: two-component sensor histidine kinase [Desulfobacterales bacterium]